MRAAAMFLVTLFLSNTTFATVISELNPYAVCKYDISKINEKTGEYETFATKTATHSIGGIIATKYDFKAQEKRVNFFGLKKNSKKQIVYGYAINTWPNKEYFEVFIKTSENYEEDVNTSLRIGLDQSDTVENGQYKIQASCNVEQLPMMLRQE